MNGIPKSIVLAAALCVSGALAPAQEAAPAPAPAPGGSGRAAAARDEYFRREEERLAQELAAKEKAAEELKASFVSAQEAESARLEKEKEALAAARAGYEAEFLKRAGTGEARRFDLGDGVSMDVVKVDSFYIGRFEVTQKQYRLLMDDERFVDRLRVEANPSAFQDVGEDVAETPVPRRGERLPYELIGPEEWPVERVTWHEAELFCKILTILCEKEIEGYRFALPTEEQWLRAAGKGAVGAPLGETAWYAANSGGRTQPVGTRRPDAAGVCDMTGNVWEWCRDEAGDGRICRGAGWTASEGYCGKSPRRNLSADRRDNDLGFRVALVPVEK